MCGICGVVFDDGLRRIDPSQLLAMRDAMSHRGPDSAGTYVSDGVALGHRRLAILDVSDRGAQPMAFAEERYQLVYNGEIYNFEELRGELESRGERFRSGSDTEVLLAMFAAEGPAMLSRLNGMFAFAIWDRQERRLFCARDRLGVKPFYYANHDRAFWFASEEKGLWAAGVPKVLDRSTLEELICFRYVAGERTPFSGIRRLLPGHYLEWHDGSVNIRRWWNLRDQAHATPSVAGSSYEEWFRTTFDDAVRLRRISDVPVGVLLSGGLDSGSVAASMAAQGGATVNSFTVRFRDAGFDEGLLSREVADRWGISRHEWTCDDEDIVEALVRASVLNDEPLVHGNDLHLLGIAKVAKPLVTVLLSGEGADECLGGYVRYQPLRYARMLAASRHLLRGASAVGAPLPPRVQKLQRILDLGGTDRIVLFNSCNTFPDELAALGMDATGTYEYREAVLAEAKATYPRTPVRQALYYDQHTFLGSILDRNDRMTMGASIECRVPFLDYRLVEEASRMPTRILFSGRRTKPLLRRALGSRLPQRVLEHPKWGFGVPWPQLLRRVPALRRTVEELEHGFPVTVADFSQEAVAGLSGRFLAGDDGQAPLVQQLVFLSIWYQAVFGRAVICR